MFPSTEGLSSIQRLSLCFLSLTPDINMEKVATGIKNNKELGEGISQKNTNAVTNYEVSAASQTGTLIGKFALRSPVVRVSCG